MKTEQKTKKGFLGMLREAFNKTGGCCGAGQTCGAPAKESDKAQTKEVPIPKEASKAAEK